MSDRHTFAFVDIVGFTAYTAAHGDAAAARLAVGVAERIRALLPEHDAVEVKSLGDGMMIRAADPAAALALAARIGDHAQSGELPRVRIGIESGPAVEHDGDWFGGTVNRTARLCAAARPGQVLVGAEARAAVNGAVPLRRRLVWVRGIDPAPVYVVRRSRTRVRSRFAAAVRERVGAPPARLADAYGCPAAGAVGAVRALRSAVCPRHPEEHPA